MAFRKIATLLAAACVLPSLSAQAEQVAVEGVYAANTDGARGISAIAIEPIRGREGIVLENALANQLGSAQIYGEPFFRLVPAAFGDEAADFDRAILRGYAGSNVHHAPDGMIERTTCLRQEIVGEKKHKKCVESLTETFECRRLHVNFNPEVALAAEEGILYRRQDSFVNSERYCTDSSYVPLPDTMLDAMVSRFARLVRLDLAPEQRFNRFRILESRKGLKGADRKAFKQAIKLTKSDPVGACMLFEEVLSRNPLQPSALYNAALCREADAQLDIAADAYNQLVLVSDSARFSSVHARVTSRFRARQQLAMMGQNRAVLASVASRGVPAQ